MLKPLLLTKDKGTVTLDGQFKRGFYFASLPIRIGVCKYVITVHKGKLRLNHMKFNIDDYTWTCAPNGQQPHYDLQEGQSYEIQLLVGESFNHADSVEILNLNFMRKAVFSYEFY